GRGGRAARRCEHRPVRESPPRPQREHTVHRRDAQQEDDGGRGLPLRRHDAGTRSLEARFGPLESGAPGGCRTHGGARARRVITSVALFDKITQGLRKTRDAFTGGITSILRPGRKLEPADYDDLEAALLRADVGPSTTDHILEDVKLRLGEGTFR